VPVRVELDFLHTDGPPQWDIDVDTDARRLGLSKGGGEMRLDGKAVPALHGSEYPVCMHTSLTCAQAVHRC